MPAKTTANPENPKVEYLLQRRRDLQRQVHDLQQAKTHVLSAVNHLSQVSVTGDRGRASRIKSALFTQVSNAQHDSPLERWMAYLDEQLQQVERDLLEWSALIGQGEEVK